MDLYTPNSLKKLRSCFKCKIILSETQFKKQGCPNCPFYYNNRTPYNEYTTSNFEGMISNLNNNISWLANKFILDKEYVNGCYSLRTIGQEMIEE